ncbi:MAG: lysophospholipid acyltransferase family protein [Prolixibacteraceae bacterium]|nr:lysophospholipid acyltransferase family protein [Prolixibacteraceae bacterium]
MAYSGMIPLKLSGFSRKLQNRTMKAWGRSILFICGIIVRKNEIPVNGHFILMPNHRGYLDIFIIAAYTPAAFIGKAELKSWPAIRQGFRLTNSIFVDRSDLSSLITTMNKIKTSVSNGIPVVVFPEGTTYKGPYTGPFKKGSFKIAADTYIPVITVAIHYIDQDDAWVGNDTFIGHFFRQLSKPLTRISVRYGNPVISKDYRILKDETRKQIDLMLENLINE